MVEQQNTPSQDPKQLLMSMTIVTGAMIMSLVIFSFLLFQTQKFVIDQAQFQVLLENLQFQVLVGMGALLLIVRVHIANLILKATTKDIPITDTAKWLQASFTPQIVRLALADASAMMGFVAAFTFNEASAFLILGVSAAIAMLREFPTIEKLKARVMAVQSLRTRGRT